MTYRFGGPVSEFVFQPIHNWDKQWRWFYWHGGDDKPQKTQSAYRLTKSIVIKDVPIEIREQVQQLRLKIELGFTDLFIYSYIKGQKEYDQAIDGIAHSETRLRQLLDQ